MVFPRLEVSPILVGLHAHTSANQAAKMQLGNMASKKSNNVPFFSNNVYCFFSRNLQ